MKTATARASLVDRVGPSAALATVPRSELEQALRDGEGAVGLVIDVTRPPRGASTTISISWRRDDVEELLRRADGDAVTVAFDPEELLHAVDPDLEAHGLRRLGAVLAVAVVAGTAAGTSAQPAPPTGDVRIDQARVENGYAPPAAEEEEYSDIQQTGGEGPALWIE
jgi:hypothetical protein